MQDCITTKTRLSVVQGEALAAETSSARVPSLAAQPFRPGELPSSLPVELGEAAAVAEDRAARAGIPAELWLRLGVEAVRHTEQLAQALDTETREVIDALDAAMTVASALAPIEARRQRAYAQHLRAALPRRAPSTHRTRYALALPDYMATAWAIAATRAATTVSGYVSSRIDRIPSRVIEWEAAAAECGETLAEWIYAVGLDTLKRR